MMVNMNIKDVNKVVLEGGTLLMCARVCVCVCMRRVCGVHCLSLANRQILSDFATLTGE